ncbi:hypothetical protein NL108_014356 [Boleophthalmus pectinirostris]|uniref:protein ADM2a n=1 Tax=Boleophthalmus pectinirostris TaxID=150288 RepID=UPI00242E1AF8|nr:protein ADM2a [Boleophthalmus pectinirostris]KAJ0037022.1 hypothetical protein NL108_014356 [Boleophthalmus pectinirostris]
MRPLLPLLPLLLAACCVSLLCRRLEALRADERTDTSRSDLINQLFDVSEDAPPSSAPASDSGPLTKWLTSLLQRRSTRSVSKASSPSSSSDPSPAPERSPLLRPRRHLSARGSQHHHAQLMRVGCKLGTCQVQNLSHRLYQLIGQRGREDSSPINPKSPHSYG